MLLVVSTVVGGVILDQDWTDGICRIHSQPIIKCCQIPLTTTGFFEKWTT
jgi:hypothetical protein